MKVILGRCTLNLFDAMHDEMLSRIGSTLTTLVADDMLDATPIKLGSVVLPCVCCTQLLL